MTGAVSSSSGRNGAQGADDRTRGSRNEKGRTASRPSGPSLQPILRDQSVRQVEGEYFTGATSHDQITVVAVAFQLGVSVTVMS